MSGIHPLDIAIVAGYFALVIYLGQRSAKHSAGEEGFFLAGRKLGKAYQFFLNFGNSTDVSSAVSTSSLVYQQGVSGVWLAFQMVFLNPYYWFMNVWFRRVRLVTMADLFEDRLGSRGLARFYALFQSLSAMIVIIGVGNLVTYKIASAIVVKPEAEWSVTERASVAAFQEWRQLEKTAAAGSLDEGAKPRLESLRERQVRGELYSYVTRLKPWPFYLIYTLIAGIYIVAGGMAATAINEVLQSALILTFSVILIPVGLTAIGGFHALGERVPAAMFELVSAGSSHVTGPVLAAILLVTLVQINGIIGNMGISGSARNEYAARFGAVSGTFAKRIMIILWSFCGLIAFALYQGDNALADPDTAWGNMSRQLLGPGLLGLMLAGVLAANMSRVAAETMCVSALFVRNVWRHLHPDLDEAGAVRAGRWMIAIALGAGVIAAVNMQDLFTVLQLLVTVNVPFGAAVMLMFFWRRLTVPAVWIAVVISALVNLVLPLTLTKVAAIRSHPALQVRSPDAAGKPAAVYFDSVVHVRPDDLSSPLEGRGRFHLELWLLRRSGLDVEALSASNRFATRFVFNALSPLLLLVGVSLLTRAPDRQRVDLFYGKMKTPIGATPELESAAVEATRRAPGRFDGEKLFPNSNWEFTRWNRTDTVGFIVCCALSAGIVSLFWLLLRLAAPALTNTLP